jgi:hypothetical protein
LNLFSKRQKGSKKKMSKSKHVANTDLGWLASDSDEDFVPDIDDTVDDTIDNSVDDDMNSHEDDVIESKPTEQQETIIDNSVRSEPISVAESTTSEANQSSKPDLNEQVIKSIVQAVDDEDDDETDSCLLCLKDCLTLQNLRALAEHTGK